MPAPRRHHEARRPVIRWVVIGLIVLSAAAAGSFGKELIRSRQIDREIQALRDEAERLKAKNFEIASLQTSLDSGEFLEREARLKLGLQKEGEQVVVLRKNEAPSREIAKADSSAAGAGGWSNPKKWFIYFADRNAFTAYASTE